MREKEGYRDMLMILMSQYPNMMSKSEAAAALSVSRSHLNEIIRKGHIKVSDGKIPIGSVTSYLCG